MKNWITLLKREKPVRRMPDPKFEDNWQQEIYERNVRQGVQSLQNGKSVKIYDDGRGYELAIEIKQRFILEYQKQLAERIQIEGGNVITVSVKP